jgi:hypothetical protein
MNIRLSRICLICITFMSALAHAASDAPPRVHHDLEVTLNPEEGTLAVLDRIRFSAPAANGGAGLAFALNAGLEPSVEDPEVRLVVKEEGSAPTPFKRYALVPGTARQSLTLRYRGRLAQRSEVAAGAARGAAPSLLGHIGPEGVLMTGAGHWYPRFDDELVTFSLEVRLPPGWAAVSQGERLEGKGDGGRDVWHWREHHPQDDIVLAANRFEIYSKPTDVAEAMVFLLEPDEAIAERYLEATARYLELYEQMIGPYPYAKFALVENFQETGYGMPSFTLLGSRVLRFPFIIDSSYPHEILHSWWGNAVYVDYASGNWSEGLTAYLADHLVQEQRGRGSGYRRRALEKYRNYVDGGKDFSLNRFRSKHGEITEAVGYNKTLMLFHMLRRRLGDAVFIDGLRRFYAEQRWRFASFSDLQAAFETASGLDLGYFFEQWVRRVGAPELRVGALSVEKTRDGYRLRGRIEQHQQGPAYQLKVPVVVELEEAAQGSRYALVMTEKALDFELPFSTKPTRFAVDPEFDLFRRLAIAESPAALGELFGDDAALFVLPVDAEESVRQGYRDLAERLGAKTTLLDESLSTLPEERAVWLLGWENRHRATFARTVADQDVEFRPGRLRIGDDMRERARECIVLVGRDSEHPMRPIGWIGCENRRAIAGLARKLPHYSSYGFLSFRGDEPRNVLKGRWQLTTSPLIASLDPTAKPSPLRLSPRPSLVEQAQAR